MPTHFSGSERETLALNTYIKLTRATESFLTRLYPGGRYHGLTGSQFGTLEVLYHLGPLCQGEIGAKLLKSPGNMTLVIDNLEKRSLIRRQRDTQDRRQITIHLTAEGQALMAEIFPRHVADLVEMFSVLTPEEQGVLGDLMKKLGQACESPAAAQDAPG